MILVPILAAATANLHFDESRRRQGTSRCLLVAALAMTSQINLTLERLIAETTAEGFVPSVLAHVRDQVGALTEGLQADGALVRFLTWRENKKNFIREMLVKINRKQLS